VPGKLTAAGVAVISFAAGFVASSPFRKAEVQLSQDDDHSVAQPPLIPFAPSQSLSAPSVEDAFNDMFSETQLATPPLDIAEDNGSEIELVSFDSFSDGHSQFDKFPHAESTSIVQPLTESETRELILSEFPNLPQPTLEGWCESWGELSRPELLSLLEQRKLMPSLLPDVEAPALPPIDSGPTAPQSPAQEERATPSDNSLLAASLRSAVSRVQQNLLHSRTDGYRRHAVRFQLSEISATASSQAITLHETQRSFQPGAVRESVEPLHLAIRGCSDLMFRLEPCGLLTRCGNFQRLSDGRIGIPYPSGDVALFGSPKLPDNVSKVVVEEDGRLSVTTADGKSQSVGVIELARVSDFSRLSTKNGVYFEVTGNVDDCLTMVPAENVVAAALESSNVDADQANSILSQLERISGFSTFAEN